MSGPTGAADDLLELLWDNGLPALRTTPSHFPPPFQPFTCSAAGSNRVHELDKQRRHDAVPPAIMEDDDDVVVGGLGGIPVHDDDHDDAVPWLHCPVIDDGDSDTAPLPPEFCAGLMMSGYSALHTAEPPEPESEPHLTATSSGIIARPQSNAAPAPAATRGAPPDTQQPKPSGGGEGVMNFTFFSRPLHRSHASAAAASPGNPLESTVVQTAAAASRLRSTPLFSEQRMAWLQPPREPRAAAAMPHAPPPAPTPHATTDGHRHHVEAEAAAAATVTQHRLRPDARTGDATTTSSVCSGNGDGSQARPSSHQHTGECSLSQDEDADDEPSAGRRSAARGTKRSRTAEVHNLSERRRRDRINEKMRALQELIPNCNKIDKASMLEEAIEYLKTLQLQVQMMSMGSTGLCVPVPPTMLMQMQMPVVRTPMAAAAPFPHLGGMGLGFGGMGLGFAGGATQFPCPVMPGAPPMAMPPVGAMFGMPPFPHVMHGAAAPVEQREAAGPARPAPGGVGAGDHRRPPVPVALPVPQGDPKLQHPKQT